MHAKEDAQDAIGMGSFSILGEAPRMRDKAKKQTQRLFECLARVRALDQGQQYSTAANAPYSIAQSARYTHRRHAVHDTVAAVRHFCRFIGHQYFPVHTHRVRGLQVKVESKGGEDMRGGRVHGCME